MDRRGVIVSIGAAAVAAALAAWWSPVVWKLAAQTLVFADAAGFRELAAPGPFSHPGGALAWLARLAASTGLTAWSWAPYAAGALVGGLLLGALLPRTTRGGGAVLTALPAFVLLAPVLLAGTTIWLLPDASMGWRNLLGFGVVAALASPGRVLRGWWPLALIPLGLAGTVPLGVYAPCGVALALVTAEGPASRPGRILMRLAGVVQFAAAPALAGMLFYDDLSASNAWIHGWALLAHVRFSALNVANLLCLAVLCGIVHAEAAQTRHRVPGRQTPYWILRGPTPYCVLAVCLAGLGVAAACRLDLRPQFRVERLGVAGDWAGVVAYEATRAEPMRMEVAWRILALHRLDRLPQDLLAQQILSLHDTTPAEE